MRNGLEKQDSKSDEQDYMKFPSGSVDDQQKDKGPQARLDGLKSARDVRMLASQRWRNELNKNRKKDVSQLNHDL